MKTIPQLLGLLMCLQLSIGNAQEITGLILDGRSKEPIPYATIIYGPEKGVITNEEGRFSIYSEGSIDSLSIASLGYETLILSTIDLSEEILLTPQTEQLTEVFLSNKNLSGKEIIEKVKQGVSQNYDFKLAQRKFFFRKASQQIIRKFDLEVEESTIEGIDQHLLNEIIASTPKENGTYKEVLGDFYGNFDLMKIDISKAANLHNPSSSKNLDELTDRLEVILRENIKKDSYLKIRSGLIGVKVDNEELEESFWEKDDEENKLALTPEEKEKELAEQRKGLLDETSAEILLLLKGMFWNEDLTFNLFEKARKYDFTVKGYAQMDGQPVYIINFEPKRGADFKGSLYVNTVDYGVHRLDYENVKAISKFSLFGIRTADDVFRGKMIFDRDGNGTYSPKYLEQTKGTTVGIDRPLTIIEKNKVVPGRNKQNELDMEIDFSVSDVDTHQFFVYESQPLEESAFNSAPSSENFEYQTFEKYNPEYWEGINIVEPNAAIQEFTARTP